MRRGNTSWVGRKGVNCAMTVTDMDADIDQLSRRKPIVQEFMKHQGRRV
jgi:hypothetical protein